MGVRYSAASSAPPVYPVTAAGDGVSLGQGLESTKVQLGEDPGQPGAPATLQGVRNIPMNGQEVRFTDPSGNYVAIKNTATTRVGIVLNRLSNFLGIDFADQGTPANNVSIFGPSGQDLVIQPQSLVSAFRFSSVRLQLLTPLQVSNYIRGGREVVDVAVNTNIAANVSARVYTNRGAAGTILIQLPSAPTINEYFTFQVVAAQFLRVGVTTGQSIRNAGTVKIAGYFESNTIGNSITFQRIASGEWVAVNVVGTWV